MGKGYVPCQVSGRYLKVHDESSLLQGGEFISIDVMYKISVFLLVNMTISLPARPYFLGLKCY